MWEGDKLDGLEYAQGPCRAQNVRTSDRSCFHTHEDVFVACDGRDGEDEVFEFRRAGKGRHANGAHSWFCHGSWWRSFLVGGEVLYENATAVSEVWGQAEGFERMPQFANGW